MIRLSLQFRCLWGCSAAATALLRLGEDYLVNYSKALAASPAAEERSL